MQHARGTGASMTSEGDHQPSCSDTDPRVDAGNHGSRRAGKRPKGSAQSHRSWRGPRYSNWSMKVPARRSARRSLRRTDAITVSSSDPDRRAAGCRVVSSIFSIRRALRSTRELTTALRSSSSRSSFNLLSSAQARWPAFVEVSTRVLSPWPITACQNSAFSYQPTGIPNSARIGRLAWLRELPFITRGRGRAPRPAPEGVVKRRCSLVAEQP